MPLSIVALAAWAASVQPPVSASTVQATLAVPSDRSAKDPQIRSHTLRGIRPSVVRQILAPEDDGQVAVEALAVALPAMSGGGHPVVVVVEIDGPSFLSHNQAELARVEVYAYALAEDGRIAGSLAQVFAADVATHGEAISSCGLRFSAAMFLDPGDYTLRILVRNDHSGAFGALRTAVVVPRPGAEGFLPPPLFPIPSGRDAWLTIRGHGETTARALSSRPLTFEGRALDPATRAVLLSGHEVEAFVLGPGVEVGDPPTSLRIEVVDDQVDGEIIASTGAEVIATGDAAEPARRIRFAVPEAPPGPYRLRLAADSAKAGSDRVSIAVPVILTHGGTRERALLWSDLRSMISSPEALDSPASEPGSAPRDMERTRTDRKRRGGRAIRRLAGRYRSVLSNLTDGSFEAARTALFELESEVLVGSGADAFKRLREAELRVARELVEHEPGLALPIVVLHDQVGEVYRQRRLFSLVGHARATVEIVAEWHVDHGGSGKLAAAALVSQGGHLQHANLPASSRRLFAHALEHDPENQAALLGMAVSLERYGNYPLAIEYLERLVAARPEFDEGLLRLAVNSLRVGRLGQARELLTQVVERDRGDWVCAVAAEELARLRLISGDVEGSRELLEAATDRMAGRSGLRLLLAHVYDRSGRPDRALAALTRPAPSDDAHGVDLESPFPSASPSARFRYDEWPQRLFIDAREKLTRSASGMTNRLVEALRAEGARSVDGGS